MSNYPDWSAEALERRIIEWRSRRLQHAKDREQLLSIWDEIEKMEAEFDRRLLHAPSTPTVQPDA